MPVGQPPRLAEAADRGPLVINQIVDAEVSGCFTRIEKLDDVLNPRVFRRESVSWQAAFLAAKVLVAYRRRGGPRTSTLPDFFTAAHAAVAGLTLLSRDASRYRTYFPRSHWWRRRPPGVTERRTPRGAGPGAGRVRRATARFRFYIGGTELRPAPRQRPEEGSTANERQ